MSYNPGKGSCKSCGAELQGKFCSRCGEKTIEPGKDFGIKKFTEQVIDGFTHFDSKIINSFKKLFFFPGQLTKNYIEGIRVGYMKPVQLFIVASIIFYFFMPASASFYSSFEELQGGFEQKGFSLQNPAKYDINKALVLKARKTLPDDASKDALRQKANAIYERAIGKAATMSKTLLFLVLPLLALVSFLLYFKKQRFYVPHVIFATHCFSFFLLLDVIFLVFYFNMLGLRVVENQTHMLPFFLIVQLYMILALRKLYKQSWVITITKGIAYNAALLILLYFYRIFITVWAIEAAG